MMFTVANGILLGFIVLLTIGIIIIINAGAAKISKVEQLHRVDRDTLGHQKVSIVSYNQETEKLHAKTIAVFNMLNNMSDADASLVLKKVMYGYGGSSGIMEHHTSTLFDKIANLSANGIRNTDGSVIRYYITTPTGDTLEQLLTDIEFEVSNVAQAKQNKQ